MATWEAGTNDSVSRGKVAFDLYVVSYDQANNRTLVHISVGVFDNNGSYGGYGTGSWSIGLQGVQRAADSVYYDFSGGGPGWIWGTDIWVDHDAAGYAYINGWASFSGSSPVGSATASGGFVVDYARVPSAPGGVPSLSVQAGVVTITSDSASSPVALSDYQYRVSTDGANWSGEVSLGLDRVGTYNAPARGVSYYFQTRATSSEGAGAWSSTSSVFVPAGGRRWTGSEFTPTATAKRWNGSAWVDLQTAKRWNGSAWVDLS